ncbi:signal recognition particle protein [bacterium]|nr:signal recognition particle protein [bacterium]
MFESLTARLQSIFNKLRGKARLSPQDIDSALREVRLSLLEADVHYKVVKEFLDRVRQRALGEEVMSSFTPAQQVIKIVRDEMINILGDGGELRYASSPPTTIMLFGLQGGGKTTTAGKLAILLKKQGKKPLLIATDVRRPAAIQQLQKVGKAVGCDVYADAGQKDPLGIAKAGIDFAKRKGYDVVIVDTQGRLHLDDELLGELEEMEKALNPHNAILVLDGMTGQDAVNIAMGFSKLRIDGYILTKMDGDARGGAALSISFITQKPIMFLGVGERYDAIEPFHPERLVSRILGMGDVLTLIEKIESAMEETEEELPTSFENFTLNDFLRELRRMHKLGPLEHILSLIPGASNVRVGPQEEKMLKKFEAIVLSMTKEERENPSIIDGSRKRRIAKGSGTTVQEVNLLLKRFEEAKQLAKTLSARRIRRWP